MNLLLSNYLSVFTSNPSGSIQTHRGQLCYKVKQDTKASDRSIISLFCGFYSGLKTLELAAEGNAAAAAAAAETCSSSESERSLTKDDMMTNAFSKVQLISRCVTMKPLFSAPEAPVRGPTSRVFSPCTEETLLDSSCASPSAHLHPPKHTKYEARDGAASE